VAIIGARPSGSVAVVSGTNGGAPGWVWNGTGWVWAGEPATPQPYPSQQPYPQQQPHPQQQPAQQQPSPPQPGPQYGAPVPPPGYPGASTNPYVTAAVGPYVPPVPGPQQQLPVPPDVQRATNRSGCLGLLVAVGAGILVLASLIWSIVAFAVHVW
jgi:hypothetical protein